MEKYVAIEGDFGTSYVPVKVTAKHKVLKASKIVFATGSTIIVGNDRLIQFSDEDWEEVEEGEED